MAGNLGIGLGPLLAAILLLVVGWRTVALVLGAPALLAGVYAWLANFDETAAVSGTAADGGSKAETGVDSVSEFLTESRRLFTGQFLLVFGIVICSGLYYRGILTFLPEVLSGFPGFGPIPVAALVPDALHELLGIEAGGRAVAPQDYFYSGLLSIGMVGQYLGGRVTDEFQVEYGLVAAFGALAVLAMLFVPASSRGLVPLAAVGALLGVCLFVVQPMYQATVAEYTPADVRGLSYGYTYLGVFGVGAVGGVVAGALLAFASTGVLFVTLAGVAVSGALLGAVLAT
jgi:MFS family permease